MGFQFNPELLIWFPVFLFSLTLHEFAHALAAKWGGDMTATYKGRLTLNPIPHIDPIGTVALPLMSALSGVPLIGWAKPVPVNDLRLRHSRWTVWVSLAGPISNLLLVAIAAIILKVVFAFNLLGGGPVTPGFGSAAGAILLVGIMFIMVNTGLAIFNMLPIPPLDGSHVFHYFFVRRNPRMWKVWEFMHLYGFLCCGP